MPSDRSSEPLTGSVEAVAAYNLGVEQVLRLESGGVAGFAQAVALDPTFALAHAGLALLGHELCAPVDIPARLRDARLHARRSTERERSHVHAVERHVVGDSAPLVAHLREHPGDALLLSVAVPTIAFAGVTTVPAEAWEIVERCRPAYADDWWFPGLLGFVRQEQGRFDEAMSLARRSLELEPRAGHAAHARAHAHYETADHEGGLGWLDSWIDGSGAGSEGRLHFSWHAALHELSSGDLVAVGRRWDAQLRPTPATGCRALVDSGSLLWRWALTPGAVDTPDAAEVLDAVEPQLLLDPPTPFMALHAAIALAAADDATGLARLAERCARRPEATVREVAAPLALALRDLVLGCPSLAADRLATLRPEVWRLGGSDAQREVVEETRICALVRAGRFGEATTLIDARLDRRHCRRDAWLRAEAGGQAGTATRPQSA